MENFFKKNLDINNKILKDINTLKLKKLFVEIKKIKKNKKKILIFGNGAGASIASHFSNDITKTIKIRCLSFDSSTHITCYANDYKFENWVCETIKSHYDKSDLIILLSASGNSKNMIKASKYCKNRKINFFSLTGFNRNNILNKNSKNHIWIDSKSYNQVEISQLIILLSLIDRLKKK